MTPAPKPAMTVRGPEMFPSASARSLLYWSNATKPGRGAREAEVSEPSRAEEAYHSRIPAFSELPMIKVVHPAYHCRPNGGHGSFCPAARRRLSCVLVLATETMSEDSCKGPCREARTFGGVCDGYFHVVEALA